MKPPIKTTPATRNAAELELFTNRFGALVADMGERLRRTAVSVNVKERLDFSCALLDPQGYLVVNAPHIPVHLGSLGLCVRSLRESVDLGPGDVALSNHPAFGGSHLPDVTVVTPVFCANQRNGLLGFVANRAHHAEIGGTRPGSMPPDARSLAEEGVVLTPDYLVRDGRPRWEAVEKKLQNGLYPSRAVAENLADLTAAVAANEDGARALRRLASDHGAQQVHHYMAALAGRVDEVLATALEPYEGRTFSAKEYLDDGSPLCVQALVQAGRLAVDFTGSADVHPGNLNATAGIVRSVVLYFLRLLIDQPLPLNEGLLQSVDLKVPRGLLNPVFPADPAQAPAVVGGNVETSQRLLDTLVKAFDLAACSQGTMNNVLFGNDNFGYYETVGGGSGATSRGPGASAVHTHMTNTAITDPEILEHRFPVRLRRFEIRRGSGGLGLQPGGDGIRRELEFLAPLELSVLTQHRVESPFGSSGGLPGRRGCQVVFRANGRETGEELELGPVDGCRVEIGDRFLLETPGGGGFGALPDQADQADLDESDQSDPSHQSNQSETDQEIDT